MVSIRKTHDGDNEMPCILDGTKRSNEFKRAQTIIRQSIENRLGININPLHEQSSESISGDENLSSPRVAQESSVE